VVTVAPPFVGIIQTCPLLPTAKRRDSSGDSASRQGVYWSETGVTEPDARSTILIPPSTATYATVSARLTTTSHAACPRSLLGGVADGASMGKRASDLP
jgi:hypothetical protein